MKDAQRRLDESLLARYETLTEDEIRTLTVEDKWFAALETAVEEEISRVAQKLANRVAELAERYADPLPQIEREVAELRAKVAAHLARMGFG